MATLNVQINGVEKRAFARYKTLRIHKDHAIEKCSIEFLDPDSTSSAFRVVPGDEIHIDRDGTALEFGGEVTRVEDRRVGESEHGTVTVVEARGWYFEAADILIPILVLPPQGLFVVAEYLRDRYLDGKGWTMLGPTTGGPQLPMLVYTNQALSDIFDDLTKKTGYPWRVNGDREMAFVVFGSLVAPYTFDDSNSTILRGATWVQERARRATRLLIHTGGTGEVFAHREDYEADSTQTSFPVHVMPPEISGAINDVAGYTIGETTIDVDGLPKSYTIREGVTLRFGGHGNYQLGSDATTDGDGLATLTIAPGLLEAVVDDQAITFGSEAFVQMELAGTPTALDGAPWSFDPEQGMLVTSGSAPDAPDDVSYMPLMQYPALVRTWDAATQNADGTFDYGAIRDTELHWPEFEDVRLAQEAGDAELAYRTEEPKELTLSSYMQDVYPWMVATCSFPGRLITGDFLIQKVTITDTGRMNQLPRVEVVMREGLSAARNWRGWWRGKDTGAQLLEVPFPLDTPLIEQSAVASHIDETSSAYSFDDTPTVGNLAVICVMRANVTVASPSTMADNQGNTYTRQIEQWADGGNGVELWTAPIATSSGTFTVTLTHAFIQQHCDVAVLEVSGANNASPIHQEATADKGFGATTGTVDLPTITTPCLVLGVGTVAGGATNAPDTGWTLLHSTAAGQGITVIYALAQDPGTYDPQWTTNSPGMLMVGVAIRAE